MPVEPPPIELTPEQTAELRRKAVASQQRRSDGRRGAVTFTGGPLDGIRIAVSEASAKSLFLGFCIVTPHGPVQVLYRHEGGAWTFDRLEPGWR